MDFKNVFGMGPTCMVLGAVVVCLLYFAGLALGIPPIQIPEQASVAIFALGIILAVSLSAWSFASLPPAKRGKVLVTSGAYKYFRHPIYASILDFFLVGLAFYLKSYFVLLSVAVLLLVWARLVDFEEKELAKVFGGRYKEYQKRTKKFIPRLI